MSDKDYKPTSLFYGIILYRSQKPFERKSNVLFLQVWF